MTQIFTRNVTHNFKILNFIKPSGPFSLILECSQGITDNFMYWSIMENNGENYREEIFYVYRGNYPLYFERKTSERKKICD
jgi:hypothetical protein